MKSASTQAQLNAVKEAGEIVASSSPEAVTAILSEAADAGLMTDIRGDARAIYPRRIAPFVMAAWHLRTKQDAEVAEWLWHHGSALMRAYGVGNTSREGVLNYKNNLQATAAMCVLAVGQMIDDLGMQAWGILSMMEVLNEIDEVGYTIEIRRPLHIDHSRDWAEYYAHETMVMAVAAARMEQREGGTTLWDYTGNRNGRSMRPAMYRAAHLLARDLGDDWKGKQHARKTGREQIRYPSAGKAGDMVVPSGWLGCWMPALLARYRDDKSGQPLHPLRIAADSYSAKSMLNATVGGTMP